MNKREKFWLKNLIWIAMILFIFIGIYFASIYKFNKAYMEEEFQELPIFQKQIEWAVTPILKNKDLKSLNNYCKDFNDTTVKIRIYNSSKKLIAASVKNDKNLILNDNVKLISNGKSRRTLNKIKKHKIIGLIKKYQINNDVYYLKLTISEEDVMKSLIQAQNYMFGFISLLIIFIIFCIIYIVQKLRIPFNSLEDSVIKISNGELDTNIEIPRIEILEELAASIKKMTNRLKLQIKRLKELEEYKSNFIQNISHEIKTPITAINSAIELLETDEQNLKPQNKECFDIILYQIKYINILINDILNLSEIEVEKTQENKDFKEFNLNEIIKTTANNFPQNNIKINIIENNKDIQITGDSSLLSQAINNLISNATKYSKSPQLDITISNTKNHSIINIKDYGIGIPQEHIPHIFERFYRVDKARSRQTGGTGLGLSIVKNIIELHQGSIELQSEENKGCEFIIKLPLK